MFNQYSQSQVRWKIICKTSVFDFQHSKQYVCVTFLFIARFVAFRSSGHLGDLLTDPDLCLLGVSCLFWLLKNVSIGMCWSFVNAHYFCFCFFLRRGNTRGGLLMFDSLLFVSRFLGCEGVAVSLRGRFDAFSSSSEDSHSSVSVGERGSLSDQGFDICIVLSCAPIANTARISSHKSICSSRVQCQYIFRIWYSDCTGFCGWLSLWTKRGRGFFRVDV